MRQWRLIVDSPTEGAVNMARDEAILQAVAQKHSLPTLRLYGWTPLCLSLGYGQRLRDVDLARLTAHAWGIVRRPTGGKAILHGNEVTYSVAIPKDHELAAGDVVESYRRISEALILALQFLGLMPASEQQAKGVKDLGPVCFEVPSHYEITVSGKKLIGSAQVRRRDGILQHGSLPLHGDIALICDALVYADESERDAAKINVRERATTLEDAIGQRLDWNTVAEAIAKGFAETFDLQFDISELSSTELAQTEQLLETVYRHPNWTNKR